MAALSKLAKLSVIQHLLIDLRWWRNLSFCLLICFLSSITVVGIRWPDGESWLYISCHWKNLIRGLFLLWNISAYKSIHLYETAALNFNSRYFHKGLDQNKNNLDNHDHILNIFRHIWLRSSFLKCKQYPVAFHVFKEVSYSYSNFYNSVSLIYPQKLEIEGENNQQTRLPLLHF